jgi:hypothetical protein
MKNLFLILIMVFGFTIVSYAQNNNPQKADQTLTKKEQVKWETKPATARELKSSEIKSQQPEIKSEKAKVEHTVQMGKIDAKSGKKNTKENVTPMAKKSRTIENKLTKNTVKETGNNKVINKTVPNKVYSIDENANSSKPKNK